MPVQVTPGDVAVHFSVLPDRYFIQTDAGEIRTHLAMINTLLTYIVSADSSESLQPVIEWHDDVNQGFTVVHLATWDRLGLFFRLAGAFSVAGLNILNARAFSRSDHIVIDTFHVVEPGYGIVQSPEVKQTFARTVHAALVDNANLLPDIQKQAGRIRLSRVATEERKLHSQLPPRVEIYRDEEMDRIIFELECRDRLGLLYRIARALFENEFDINFARINTERGTALGTFFLSNADSAHSPEADRIHSLNTAIHSLISEPEDG
jgi:[protein-PII] uridylyltransferase